MVQLTLRTKTAAVVSSNYGALLLLKPSVPSHQNPGTLLPMNPKTKVPHLNPVTLSQHKADTMKHVILLHYKPGAPSQPKLDTSSHPKPRVLISQSPKSLPQHKPGVSTLQIPKFLLHIRPKFTSHKTPHNLPHPKLRILLPKTLKIPSPLKRVPHLPQITQAYHFPNLGPQSPITPKLHYPPDLPDRGPTFSESKHIHKHNLKSHKS